MSKARTQSKLRFIDVTSHYNKQYKTEKLWFFVSDKLQIFFKLVKIISITIHFHFPSSFVSENGCGSEVI